MMEVVILTEGGKNIGLGHITRCLSLYQAFEKKGILPKFIVNGDNTARDLLRDKENKVFDWLTERERLFNLLRGAKIAIVDSYLADLELYKDISKMAKIPVYIDDNKRLDYPKGVIINGAIDAKNIAFPKKDGTRYLLGSAYAPLRKDFWEAPEKEIKDDIENVTVTFGGDDSRNITPKVLKLLCRSYPELVKKVVVGSGFKNIDGIEKAKDKKTELIYHPEASRMKRVLLESDIAISGGGQTLYELARLGVPSIAIAIADNQLNNIEGWEGAGFLDYAGWWEDKETLNNLLDEIEDLRDRKVRLKRSILGKRLVDGKGSLRVRDILLKIMEETSCR